MERRTDDREDKDNLLDSLHHHLSCKRMVRTAQTIISKLNVTISWTIGTTGNFFYKKSHRNGENGKTQQFTLYLCKREL